MRRVPLVADFAGSWVLRSQGAVCALVAIWGSCAPTPPAVHAPRTEFAPPVAVREFLAPEGALWELRDVRFLMWKRSSPEAAPAQVAAILSASQDYDDAVLASYQVQARQSDLKRQFADYGIDIGEMDSHYSLLCSDVRSAQKNVERAQKRLDSAGDHLSEKDRKELESKLAAAQQTLTIALADRDALVSQLIRFDSGVAWTEWQLLPGRLRESDDRGNAAIGRMKESAWLYESSIRPSIEIQFGAHSIPREVTVRGWDLQGWSTPPGEAEPDLSGDPAGPQEFSVIKGTVSDVTYESRGGVFRWTLAFQDGSRVKFLLSRTKYDFPDGRIYYQGEIERHYPDGRVRWGVIKAADRLP